MMRVLIAAIAAILLSSCSIAPTKNEFFAPGTVSDYEVEWYGGQLIALGQRPLPPRADELQLHLYRFTRLRSFDKPIVIVLKVERRGRSTLNFYEASGAGGYPPGYLRASAHRRVGEQQTQEFLKALETASFWSMPPQLSRTTILPNGDEIIQLDGAQWILEGIRDGQYHFVDRWMPEPGPYRDALLLLLRFSGRNVEPVY